MLNRLHAAFHRPERGWDPVSAAHANHYSELQWASDLAEQQVDRVELLTGAVRGKRVLDLGAGPGRHSVVFASRGALVTWHDVSGTYLEIARARAAQAEVELRFSLGYLEDAAQFLDEPFDLVFCSGCWLYSMNDRQFAELVYGLVRPWGAACVRTPTAEADAEAGTWRRMSYGMYAALGLKIGHLHPPHGKVARLFNALPLRQLIVDYSDRACDEVVFLRAG